MTFTNDDMIDLKIAKELLENPGLAARITDIIGTPIEKGMNLLPDKWLQTVGELTQTALTKAADAAIFTMKDVSGIEASNKLHKLYVSATGAVGGAGGYMTFAFELPISTTIMLRSILDIARSEGESINDPEAKLASLEVFALGGPTKGDDASESGYFAIRAALAKSITEAAEYMVERTVIDESAPAIVRFIVKIAERFSIQVTEKGAAQAIPVVGAFTGAILNLLFIDHFQDMARGHFIVRRLERKYGAGPVEENYNKI